MPTIPSRVSPPGAPSAARVRPSFRDPVHLSPFEVAVAGDGAATAPRTKAQLLAMSRRAELRQHGDVRDAVVLVTLQHARFWTRRTREVYEAVSARGATVVVFGVGLPTDLGPVRVGGVGTVGIGEDDLLADEWLVLFCSPRERRGFVARRAGAGLPGARSGPRVPPAVDGVEGADDLSQMFLWADLRDPVWLERASAVLLTRVPSLSVMVPWLQR